MIVEVKSKIKDYLLYAQDTWCVHSTCKGFLVVKERRTKTQRGYIDLCLIKKDKHEHYKTINVGKPKTALSGAKHRDRNNHPQTHSATQAT